MLTWQERVSLHNQFKILEILDPDHAEDYKQKQEIVARGYEGLYSTINEEVSGEPVPKTLTDEIHEIFDLFRALHDSKKRLSYAPSSRNTDFSGFDGHHETEHHSYANFVLDRLGKWEESKDRPRNSHAPMISKYTRMLAIWHQNGRAFKLKETEIEQIGEA
jgi:uncharacterized protein YfbU (UPF0304 family)